MKRVNSFLIAAFVAASSMFVVSCGEDTEEDNPSVSVSATYGNNSKVPIAPDGSIEALQGTAVTLDIVYTMGKDKLTNIKMMSKVGTKNFAVLDSTLDAGLLNFGAKDPIPFRYDTNVSADPEELTLKATDKKGRESSFVLTIKVKKPDDIVTQGDVFKYAILGETKFGCQGAAAGSFSTLVGEQMTVTAAKNRQSDVDLVFYFATNSKVGCVADTEVKALTIGGNKLSAWAPQNTLYFVRKSNYASSSTSALIKDSWFKTGLGLADDATLPPAQNISTATKIDNLQVGDVVFFQKGTGTTATFGAFIVTTIATSTAGNINGTFVTITK